jgi:hypothetical protein
MPAAAKLPSGGTDPTSPPAVLTLTPGTEITANERRYRIQSIRDLQSVIAQDIETGVVTRIPLAEVSRLQGPTEPALTAAGLDLCSIPEEAWTIARQRFEAIEPLLAPGASSLDAVAERAKTVGKHRATLYRWLNTWLKSGTLIALLPNQPGAATGQKRLAADVEEIISTLTEERYLTRQKITPEQIAREVIARCARLGIAAPHSTTVRRRIAAVAEQTKVRAREGGKEARQRFYTCRRHVARLAQIAALGAALTGSGRSGGDSSGMDVVRTLLSSTRSAAPVEAAGAVNLLPLAGPGGTMRFEVMGAAPPQPGEFARNGWRQAQFRIVDGDYFRALGIPLLVGRALGRGDRAGGPCAVVVNERFVRAFGDGASVISRSVRGLLALWATCATGGIS